MLKGLLLKNLYSTRFFLITLSIIQAIIYANVLMAVDIINELGISLNNFAYLFTALDGLFIMTFSSFAMNIVLEDKKCGWEQFCPALPVSQNALLASRLIICGLHIALNTCIAIIFNLMLYAITGVMNLEAFIFLPIALGVYGFVALSAGVRLCNKLSFHAAEIWYILIIVLYVIVAIVFTTLYLSGEQPLYAIRIVVYCAAAALMIPACKPGKKVSG